MSIRARFNAAVAKAEKAVRSAVSALAGVGVVANTVFLSAPSTPPKGDYSEPDYRSSIVWSPRQIRSAESLADTGNLRLAAQLCETLIADDRVRGCLLEVRVRGLLGLPLSYLAGVGRKRQQAIKALEVDEDWTEAFPEDVLAEWMAWGILLGVSFGKLTWVSVDRKGGKRLIPKLEVIHPQNMRWDHATKSWYAKQTDGSEIKITAGDGTWVIYTPYGQKRPWARGAWRSISRWCLLKQYAQSDWGRYSERHGMGLWVGSSPDGSNPADRAELAADLKNIGRESSVAPPPGWDVKLVESTANTWQTYQAQVDCANTAISITVLGQNLSTEVTGGSYAATSIHAAVKAQIIRADDECSATTLRSQALVWWAQFNYGSRELAPWPCRETDLPEDRKAKADTLLVAGQALTTWQDAGFNVDVEAYGEEFGMPEGEEDEKQSPPPPPNGDQLPPDGQPDQREETSGRRAGKRALAQESLGASKAEGVDGASRGQAYVDALTASARDKAADALSPWIDELLEHIESATDWDSLKTALVKAYPTLDNDEFANLAARAAILAELRGMESVVEDL